jgi:hypothetical protein
MFQPGRYDLVLMDIEMPVMDGYGATHAIRQTEQETGAAATPVLALTAHAFADMAMKSREAGFTAHLTKPIRKASLLEAVSRWGRIAVESSAPPVPLERGPSRVKIRVEAGMEDVVPGYLAKRQKEIQQYRQALESQDFDTIRMLGHKMKGTGAGYGFAELTSLGSALEQAALQRDSSSIRTKVDELATYVDSVELEYPN